MRSMCMCNHMFVALGGCRPGLGVKLPITGTV